MNSSRSIDSTSPFFASIASQNELKRREARESKGKKKITTSFNDYIKTESKTSITTTESLPEHLKGLSQEKILESLLDSVYSTGDALKESQSPNNILDYKKSVKTFIKYIVDNTFETSEHKSNINISRRKKFIQIEVVDKKLEQLANEIISNQKNQLLILEKIEEINGILVDLIG